MPSELKSGVVWGADYGYVIDENVSLLIGGDLYYRNIRNITKTGEIEDMGIKQEEFQELSEWTGYHIPITGKFKIKFPMQGYRFKPYGIGGVGFGLTHVSFEGTDISNENQKDSLTYTGFVWQLGGGILYRIGSKSNLIIEIIYNRANFEKENENYFTTLDSSGLMLRAGINVLMF
jgi:opacity protein-like surface antigen